MKLPSLSDLEIKGKRVLLRADLDTEPKADALRIKVLKKTLNFLREKGAERIIILAHRGRPLLEAVADKPALEKSFSLKPFQPFFAKWHAEVKENLRFDEREEKNDKSFAEELARLGDLYVNEAFANSHRAHTSIVALPLLFKARSKNLVAAGIRFHQEVKHLTRIIKNPERPLTFILGGAKEDKLSYLWPLAELADKILVGGKLPIFVAENAEIRVDMRFEFAKLNPDGKDITLNSIEVFEADIAQAKTIILAGPMGKFEEEGQRMGTERIFKAVAANKKAYKVAGGGETIKAIKVLGQEACPELAEGFGWISVGGGAMLEFLAKGTLPGIEALKTG